MRDSQESGKERPYLERRLETLQERWYLPMGFRLKVTTNSSEILAAADSSFGGFGEVNPQRDCDFSFRFFRHEIDDGELGRPLYRTHGQTLYQTTGRDSTMVVDRAAGSAFGFFSPTTLGSTAFFRWHFLDAALFFLLESRGFIGVHGAAMCRAGEGCLLRAPSGQGKTTLAYAAARSDWQALAEDVVWIDSKSGTWWGAPWAFRMLPDAPRIFPELKGKRPTVQINGEEKIEVELEEIRPGSTVVSAPAGKVIFLRRAPGRQSRLLPLTASQAGVEWLAGCASREREVPDYDRHVADLLREKTYRLEFGDDIDHALKLVASVVDHG